MTHVRNLFFDELRILLAKYAILEKGVDGAMSAVVDFKKWSTQEKENIRKAREELNERERAHERKRRRTGDALSLAAGMSQDVKRAAKRVRARASDLLAAGTPTDAKSLQRLGILQSSLSETVLDSRISNMSPSGGFGMTHQLYGIVNPYEWDPCVESSCVFYQYDGSNDPPSTRRYLRVLQNPHKSIYRFFLVDRDAFGRRALLVDGVFGEDGTIRVWGTSISRAYGPVPDSSTTIALQTKGIDNVLDVVPERLTRILSPIIGTTVRMPVEWDGGFLPLEELGEYVHRRTCAFHGSVVSFRVIPSSDGTKVKAVQVLVRGSAFGQLEWFTVKRAKDIAVGLLPDQEADDSSTCRCSGSLAKKISNMSVLSTSGTEIGVDVADLWSWADQIPAKDLTRMFRSSPFIPPALGENIGISTTRGNPVYHAEVVEPVHVKPRVSPPPGAGINLSENVLIPLGPNGEELLPPKERSVKRTCGHCGVFGVNRNSHFKPNHGQREMTQEDLLQWHKSLVDDPEQNADNFILVKKR